MLYKYLLSSAVCFITLNNISMANASNTHMATTETCKHTNPQEISALFDKWNNSLQTLDSKKVVAHYAEDSILLPTVSNKPRFSTEEKLDYFKHFLQKKPIGRVDNRHIKIHCNNAIDSGLYTFTFGDGKGVKAVKARYTFAYHWNGKEWLITSHHSSLMPENG